MTLRTHIDVEEVLSDLCNRTVDEDLVEEMMDELHEMVKRDPSIWDASTEKYDSSFTWKEYFFDVYAGQIDVLVEKYEAEQKKHKQWGLERDKEIADAAFAAKVQFDLYAYNLRNSGRVLIPENTTIVSSNKFLKIEEDYKEEFLEFACPVFYYNEEGNIESEEYPEIEFLKDKGTGMKFLEAYPTYESYVENFRELYDRKMKWDVLEVARYPKQFVA